LNFTGADLVEVIHVLAQYLKLNYTIDPGVRGTVTLYSAQPLRQPDLLPIFHQVLRMNDAVAVKSGEFYHIAPINAGKGMVRPARRLGERGYILQVVPVRFFTVSEIKRLLEPFITPGGEILEYPRGNFLIILDLAINIQRLLEIKDLIDVNVFAGVRMELYQPKVASAEELADEMGRIMQAYAASTTQSENFVAQFIPVPRINRLLVISHSEAAWSYAMRWLERIDTYAEGPGRRIFVYPVENGKAVDLADILNQVLGQGATGSSVQRKTLKDVAERIAGGQQQTPSGGSSAGQPGTGTGQSGSLYAVAPTQAPPPPTRPRAGAEAGPTA
jgi:general secretion pathway protein D